jgi:2,4-dienoyl-CoA reductase-like NADH-dependent reductase (Old Yellow Enzyme family)
MPISIGPLQIKNRVMQLPTRIRLERDNRITEEFIAFYEERAKGGVGSMILPISWSEPPTRHGTYGPMALS